MSRHADLIAAGYEATAAFLAEEQGGDDPGDGDPGIEVATVPEMEVETQVPEDQSVAEPESRSADPSP